MLYRVLLSHLQSCMALPRQCGEVPCYKAVLAQGCAPSRYLPHLVV